MLSLDVLFLELMELEDLIILDELMGLDSEPEQEDADAVWELIMSLL